MTNDNLVLLGILFGLLMIAPSIINVINEIVSNHKEQ